MGASRRRDSHITVIFASLITVTLTAAGFGNAPTDDKAQGAQAAEAYRGFRVVRGGPNQ
ncbi:MAG: hypothetical protein GTO46_07215 [Gemmatimonadetes bacterium]|nr:hypothetical protein [Gemmatimonadota bacterium]NIO31420.1 hypothetical protein [Gemmatimonadota bacterium]